MSSLFHSSTRIRINSYLVTVLPAVIAFYQLYVLYEIDVHKANEFYKLSSLILLTTSVLALNTNYIFMLRVGSGLVSTKSEYSLISLYRILTYFFIVSPLIILNTVNYETALITIVFGLSKLSLELINNFFRSKNILPTLYKNVYLNTGVDFIILTSILLTESKNFFVFLIVGYIVQFALLIKRIIPFLGFNDFYKINKKQTIKFYLKKIGPLSLSSIRENLSTQGITFFGSLSFGGQEYALLVNAIKIYSSGTILLNVLNNFYMQSVFKTGIRKFKDEMLLSGIIILGTIFIKLILMYTGLFENTGNSLGWFLVVLYAFGILFNLQYIVKQGLCLKANKYLILNVFEITYISTSIICFLMGTFTSLFLASFFSYLIAFSIINLYTYVTNYYTNE